MKRDPALDRFCDLDDFRLLMLDRTFPTKSFARTYGRLDLAHRAPPTLSVSPECAAIHHRESLLKLAANPACVVCLRGIGKENGHWHTPLRLRPPERKTLELASESCEGCRGFRLKVGSRSIDPKALYIYQVERLDGPRLFLLAEGPGFSGWALAGQVVAVGQPNEFSTNYIRANLGDPKGYTMRDETWKEAERKRFEIAIDDLNEAIRLDPNRAVAYIHRGNLWRKTKEYDKAIADYNEAIRLDPEFATAHYNRGVAWWDKKECDKANADYSEAIRLDPKFAFAYNNRGLAWAGKKNYDKAIADYNEAIRLDSKYAMAYNNRGVAWWEKKEYDNAIADANEAIRLDSKLAMAYNNRGLAWAGMKKYDMAIADYNKAIRLEPKYGNAYNSRAWLWATCPDANHRDGKKAVESALKSCELSEWKRAYSIGTLAAACAEVGDFDGAVKWQSTANELYTCTEDKANGEERLKLYQVKKPYRVPTP